MIRSVWIIRSILSKVGGKSLLSLKTLHAYLTRQVVLTLLMTAGVFTFVLLLGNVLKDIFILLVSSQASLWVFLQAIGMLVLYVWAFALPMAMLTATLLVFGRFSADQELTAARASGISLVSLTTPILVLSLVLCGFCALVNMEIAPRCWNSYRSLTSRLKADIAEIRLPEGRPIKDFEGVIFHIGRNRNQNLQDIMVMQLTDKTNVTQTIRAARGKINKPDTNGLIVVELFDAKVVGSSSNAPFQFSFPNLPIILDTKPTASKPRPPKIREMTYSQLKGELRELERLERRAAPASTTNTTQILERSWRDMEKQMASPIRTQIHQQVAASFACFGFALIGIPLAIRVQRRETNIGFAMAMILVFVYYCFVLIAQGLKTRPEFAPHLLMWLPNFIFQAVGVVLLWRANKGV
jgi:lipopolysaccharide export system permease protein